MKSTATTSRPVVPPLKGGDTGTPSWETGTADGTPSGTSKLKALADAVLNRDKKRDSRGDGSLPALQPVGSRDEHPVPPPEAVDLDRLDATRHALLIDSRLLGEAVWLVSDESHAGDLRRELARDDDQRLIFTLAEVEALRGMAEADARTIADVKRHFAGAALRSVEIVKGIG